MKRPFVMLAAMALGSSVWAQQLEDNTVVMTVAGKNVSRAEFEYSFQKNNNELT